VPLVEQKLLTHSRVPEFTSDGIDLLFYVHVCTFVLFLLAIVLSFLLLFTDSDYPLGVFKLFLHVEPYLEEADENSYLFFLNDISSQF
jgi:hypothetical protein